MGYESAWILVIDNVANSMDIIQVWSKNKREE